MASIFSRIIAGELPGRFVWRDDRVVAFLSIEPMRPGHTLVVPRAEVAHWIDLDADLCAHVFEVARVIGQAQSAAFAPRRIGVMIVGGFQEPAHGAANSLHGLFTRPDQATRIAADPPAWSAAAVEEGLRWLAPFGMTEKLTTAEVTLGDIRFPAGTEVAMVLASANRDEARYVDPDTFDLDRPRQNHAAFGYGLHFCLGHFVARQLERVMIEEMFARLPNLRPHPDQETIVHGWAVRAAKRLPVVWDALSLPPPVTPARPPPPGLPAPGLPAARLPAPGLPAEPLRPVPPQPVPPQPVPPQPVPPQPAPLAVG